MVKIACDSRRGQFKYILVINWVIKDQVQVDNEIISKELKNKLKQIEYPFGAHLKYKCSIQKEESHHLGRTFNCFK